MITTVDRKSGARAARQLCWLPIEDISPNPDQPRREFTLESLEELTHSIRQYGLLSPISVRRSGEKYEIIAGERRLRACKQLGMTHIDAIVLPAPPKDSALIALVENLQREELHYLEEAQAFRKIIREYGLTQEELARRVGKSQAYIGNRLRLSRLPENLQNELRAADLSERHARAILRLRDPEQQAQTLKQVIERNLNVAETEARVDVILLKQEEKPPKHGTLKRVYRDHRIFVNAVLNVARQLKEAGVQVKSDVKEKEDCVEVLITLPKIARNDAS